MFKLAALPVGSRLLYAFGSLALLALAQGCSPRYLATDFASNYQTRTKVVAIAPLENRTNDPSGVPAAQMVREAIVQGLQQRQDGFTVTIQEPGETDRRIHDASLSDSAASRMPAPELCRLLGVDAVMTGEVTRYEKKGTAGQVATAVLGGSAKGSEVRVGVAIYDGQDGRMIWQHDIKKMGGFLSSPDALRKPVGATVAGKFPYKKHAR